MPNYPVARNQRNPKEPLYFPDLVAYLVAGLLCFLVLKFGLLGGLLAVCLGFYATSALIPWCGRIKLPPSVAVALVIIVPLLLLGWAALQAKGFSMELVSQYKELLNHLAKTVLDIRAKLPADLAKHLPADTSIFQAGAASYLKSNAGALTGFASTGFHGLVLAYAGLIVGALAALRPVMPSRGPLVIALQERTTNFGGAFKQIAVAQVWIAAFNTACTTGLLFLALPLFNVYMPYATLLVALTFLLGLIPLMGNLVVNALLTVVGVSVSPLVGLSCLIFLIVIHKFEYVVNAKVIGSKTKTAAWELLAVMFGFEAIFGMAGLVAGPLFYAYLKKELQEKRLV